MLSRGRVWQSWLQDEQGSCGSRRGEADGASWATRRQRSGLSPYEKSSTKGLELIAWWNFGRPNAQPQYILPRSQPPGRMARPENVSLRRLTRVAFGDCDDSSTLCTGCIRGSPKRPLPTQSFGCHVTRNALSRALSAGHFAAREARNPPTFLYLCSHNHARERLALGARWVLHPPDSGLCQKRFLFCRLLDKHPSLSLGIHSRLVARLLHHPVVSVPRVLRRLGW